MSIIMSHLGKLLRVENCPARQARRTEQTGKQRRRTHTQAPPNERKPRACERLAKAGEHEEAPRDLKTKKNPRYRDQSARASLFTSPVIKMSRLFKFSEEVRQRLPFQFKTDYSFYLKTLLHHTFNLCLAVTQKLWDIILNQITNDQYKS